MTLKDSNRGEGFILKHVDSSERVKVTRLNDISVTDSTGVSAELDLSDMYKSVTYTVPLTPNIYKGMILDKIANVDVDIMNDTLDNIHIDCDLSEYEIDVINKAVDSEPDNYFKTKYLIPEVENPNYFLVGRTHPDTDMVMYTMLPMSQYHRLHMAESNKSPLIETSPKVRWFRMSSLSAHRLHSFNPSQNIADITQGITDIVNKIFGK